ncbi:MAG: penicillin acylase family protein [Pseudomonadota bacterium]
MVWLFRWLVRLLAGAFVLALLAVGLVYYLATRSLPDYDATWEVARLDRPVEIVRDSHAIPHIFGETDRDVLFGLGFAHAQDRLWQMTLMRRTAEGRLSELFGAETVSIDHLMRALDLYGHALAAAERQSPRVTAELEAYAAGVNAYLDLIQEEALGRGAPEFFLFEPRVAPWTPADSIAIQKLMAFQLTDMASREVLRAQLSLRLEPERVEDLMPEPADGVIALPDYAETLGPVQFARVAPLPRHPLSPVAEAGFGGASNAWAVDGSRAAARAPLLANDPHLPLYAPGWWMLARLEFASGGVIGGTIPGLPAVLVGRSEKLAWGLTTAGLDDQDIFIERLGDDPDTYATPAGPKAFVTRDTIINIAGAPPRTLTLRWTRHGPVIPPPHYNAADVTPEGHVAALAWTALTSDDRTIEAMLDVMRAPSVDAALEASVKVVAPAQNLMLADQSGIAMRALGHAPRRDPASLSQGRLPSAGWLAENDWTGSFPVDSNPGVRAPSSGVLVNTNNRITDAPFPNHWTFDWGDSHRIRRATRLLNGREFHTLESFVGIQTDQISPAARALLPLVARDLWYQGEPAAEGTPARQRQTALAALAAWNGEMGEHAFEPLIYAAWMRELQRRLIVDDIGPLAARRRTPVPLFIERVFLDENGASAWCDIRQSATVETCETIARLALDAALVELTEAYGARIESWRWGSAHTALHRHQSLGQVPGLGWLVNIRQQTPGGDHTLLRGAMRNWGEAPYTNVHGSGLRIVVDFADPESSAMMIATGQSGHVLSRHYDDLSLLWRRLEYIPMTLDPTLARGGAVGVTRLRPKG